MDPPLLRNIFNHLDDLYLLSLRIVSKEIKHIVDLILLERFAQRFGLLNVGGMAPPAAFVVSRLHHFAHVHCLHSSRDSLSTIALRYRSDVATLRRLNNIISDHTFASRSEIVIPITDYKQLTNQSVRFEYISCSRRWMWLIRTDVFECVRPALPRGGGSISTKLIDMLSLALRIDRATAAFYLTQSDGDLREAMKAYNEDLVWDKRMKQLRKSLVKTGRQLPKKVA